MRPLRSRRWQDVWQVTFVDPMLFKTVVVASFLLAILTAGLVLIMRGLM